MKLFTTQEMERMAAHGLKRPKGRGDIKDIDFCSGDMGDIHMEIRMFNQDEWNLGKYEVLMVDTPTRDYVLGRGNSLQGAFENALSLLEVRKKAAENLVEAIGRF